MTSGRPSVSALRTNDGTTQNKCPEDLKVIRYLHEHPSGTTEVYHLAYPPARNEFIVGVPTSINTLARQNEPERKFTVRNEEN